MEKALHKYLKDLGIAVRAGSSLIVTRTSEPLKVLHSIPGLIDGLPNSKRWTPHGWTCVTGLFALTDEALSGDIPIDYDTQPLLVALSNKEVLRGAITGFVFPHWEMESGAVVTQLKLLGEELVAFPGTIILIAPIGEPIPKELQNDVAIIDLELPTAQEQEMVLNEALEFDFPELELPMTEEERNLVVGNSLGMTTHQFANAIASSIIGATSNGGSVQYGKFCRSILDTKIDMVKGSDVLSVEVPEDISNVGGLNPLKTWLEQCAACFDDGAKALGILPKGALVVGSPGSGKSLIGKAASMKMGVPLVRFNISAVFDKYVGNSEAKVSAALKLLGSMAPCCVLVDEIDKAGLSAGNSGDSGVGTRVLGAILSYMQDNGDKGIFWMFTANRVDSIPPELIRPGRIDRIWGVLPPREDERAEIARIHIDKRLGKAKAKEIGISKLIAITEGYNGSEIETGIVDAIREWYAAGNRDTSKIRETVFLAQFGSSRKPMSEIFVKDYRAMSDWVKSHAYVANSAGVVVKKKTAVRKRRAVG